jgi:hypothetical protein
MDRTFSRSEFARLAGVSPMAITKACRKALAPACERDRIRGNHPAAAAYLAAKGRALPATDGAPTASPAATRKQRGRPTTLRPAPRKGRATTTTRRPKQADPEPGQPRAEATELEAFARLLRPLADRYGTARGFRDWLLALKDLEAIRAKMLENEETEGRLISRELVKTHVLGAVEAANRRLLTDSPKTIARRLYAACNGKVPVEDAEQMVREAISSQLRPAHQTAARLLREDGAGDDDAAV